MADGKSHSLDKSRARDRNRRSVDKEALEMFCQQISSSTSLHSEWDINTDPQEEIELLFNDLRIRSELVQGEEYCFDNELPRAIFRSFRVKPFMYTDISGLWIIQESGIPILSFNWRPSPDQILLAGFFGAVCSFAGSLGQDLREIVLEGTRFLVLREPKFYLIFTMAVPFSLPAPQGLALLTRVKDAFISRYHHYFSSGTDIVMTKEFTAFNNYLTDLFIKTELKVYLQTGVLRAQNPLVFQLARSILPCTDDDLKVLSTLEKSPGQVFTIQKVIRKSNLSETIARTSLRQLEELDLVKCLRDGRAKRYASNLRSFLLGAAADPNLHQLVDLAVKEFQQLIDSRLSRTLLSKQLSSAI
ncbi:MAG: hypothetical protein ACFFB3_05590 [Candidatus Hodarchaeota archaeon]